MKFTKILAVVKADAYGSGLVEVTRFLEQQGVNNFGVAYLPEKEITVSYGTEDNFYDKKMFLSGKLLI